MTEETRRDRVIIDAALSLRGPSGAEGRGGRGRRLILRAGDRVLARRANFVITAARVKGDSTVSQRRREQSMASVKAC